MTIMVCFQCMAIIGVIIGLFYQILKTMGGLSFFKNIKNDESDDQGEKKSNPAESAKTENAQSATRRPKRD